MLRQLVSEEAASLANWLIAKLHNGDDLRFSREELRSVRFSFSQMGEDLAVYVGSTDNPAPPIYVDAGCYHPIFGSNTLLLHKRG